MQDTLVVGRPSAELTVKLGNTASQAGISIRANEAPSSLASLKIQWGKNGEEDEEEEKEEE